MKKINFIEFYDTVVKELGQRFAQEYPQFRFVDSADSLYEEYLTQKTLLRMMYEKDKPGETRLLDRHKVCACMTTAIIKLRLISNTSIVDDTGYSIMAASKVNEQLAFMSAWELFKGFVRINKEDHEHWELPITYHNASFLDTITRSLFFANQTNSLSVPLIANIFFLLERYCEGAQGNDERAGTATN